MGKLPAAIAASLVASSAVMGCTGHTGHTNAVRGTVTGIFLMVGGPAGASIPLPGHVIATSTAGERITVRTGKSGKFTVLLPPDIYHLTGYSPRVHSNGQEMRCVAAHPVRVQPGKSIRGIEVICSVR